MRSLPNILISALALIVSIFALWEVRGLRDERSLGAASEIQAIDRVARLHATTLTKLAEPSFAEPNQGLLASYLAKIRRDGLPAHKDFKQQLDSLARANGELTALIDLYLPNAKTTEFVTQANEFRTYAVTWNDRWNTVMEYFMAGGSYPASEVAFPAGFPAAIQGELAARN